MNAKTERTLAGLAVGVLLFVWFGIFLQVYYVPMLTAGWAETDRELSSAQQLLVTVASFTSRNLLGVLPLLAVVTVAAIVWRLLAIRKARKNTTMS